MPAEIERVSNLMRCPGLPALSHDQTDLTFHQWNPPCRHFGNVLAGQLT